MPLDGNGEALSLTPESVHGEFTNASESRVIESDRWRIILVSLMPLDGDVIEEVGAH